MKENKISGKAILIVGAGLFLLLVFSMSVILWAESKQNPVEGNKDGGYPGKRWQTAQTPEQFGWSSEKLDLARQYSKKIGSAAVMIVDNGIVIDAWGDIARKFRCHSMRKSLLSALIGIHVNEGRIDLSKTLEELGIDDKEPSLSPVEKQAAISDLIKARSGIYHSAVCESRDMQAKRPQRYSHEPGTFWYYNNWDFNALGTIYEQETGTSIFEDFDRRISKPLNMEDFKPGDCCYTNCNSEISIHPKYQFRMSTRDLARFGLLFLRQGKWQDQQVIPSAWIRDSIAPHSEIGKDAGYGYMWWTWVNRGLYPHVRVKGQCYCASGYRGQRVIVLPYRNLVIVHRVNTDEKSVSLGNGPISRLLWLILDAAGETQIGDAPLLEATKGVRLKAGHLHDTLAGNTVSGEKFSIFFSPDGTMTLAVQGRPADPGRWWVEDDQVCFWLTHDTGGKTACMSVVLDGSTVKWFDPDGILKGKGVLTRRSSSSREVPEISR